MIRLKDVNWNQVYYFYEVAKRLSMKHAAQYLGVSLPTISEQIKRLETSLDVQLFRREVRRLELAPDGEKLFQSARDMFEAGYRFIDTLSPDSIGGYAVRVGLPETILLVAVNFVTIYWDQFAPFGTVNTVRELFFERMIERILKNEIDWGIVLSAPKVARIDYREIGKFRIAFCCAEGIYNRFRRKEDLIRALPLARMSWDTVLNEAVDARLREAGIYPKEVMESEHREVCMALTKRGRCVGTFSTMTLDSEPLGEGLKAFHIGEPIELKLYAIWNKANDKMIAIRKLRELIDLCVAIPAADPELQLRASGVPPDWLVDLDSRKSLGFGKAKL